MEGLIPYIVNALKRNKSQSRYRCSSSGMSSSRNYYYQPLNSNGSSHGSSHRRTRSEFQPPVADFLGQHSGAIQLEFLHSRSVKTDYPLSPSNVKSPKKLGSYTQSASKETAFNSRLRR